MESACTKLGIDCEKYFNIACIGHVATGKTTFIEALGGIPKSVMRNGSICYEFNESVGLTNVRVYDFPGSGPHNRDNIKKYLEYVEFNFLKII